MLATYDYPTGIVDLVSRHHAAGRRLIMDELEQLAGSSDFVMTLAKSSQIASLARRSPHSTKLIADLSSFAAKSTLATLLAAESLSQIRDAGADEHLIGFLASDQAIVQRHGAWRLQNRPPTRQAYAPLLGLLVTGGINTMHAHRTLRAWADLDPDTIAAQITSALESAHDPAARARLVDLLGSVQTKATRKLLQRVALDSDEAPGARISAISGLGEDAGRQGEPSLQHLATLDDVVGTYAALALDTFTTVNAPTSSQDATGLRIAQLVLAGGLDGQLSLGGKGDTGGVASLLVSLSDSLARRSDVDHVLTIGRGTVNDALTGPETPIGGKLSFGMIVIGDDARPAQSPDQVWEQLPTIERGIRRVLRRSGPVDVVHLRMADAGTLAGAEVAKQLGIPVCFSLAPDPHNVVQSLQRSGELDADSFVQLTSESHVWFRARLVERLAHDADRVALFPRVRPLEFFAGLGMDSAQFERRSAVVAEGIDLTQIERATIEHSSAADPTLRQHDVLEELKDRLPEHRRQLPLLLSVGRLHPVKGMERVVRAWTGDSRLRELCNLVIIGGDLDEPSEIESAVLAEIDQILTDEDRPWPGFVMLGGRPRSDVTKLQVATALGNSGAWAGGGIYVDGALKEEFGLAVLEALAAGLVVVAPSTGGPATYVDHGDTGILAEPGADLAQAIHAAFELVNRPGRASRASALVRDRYSIDTMAEQLAELYRPVMALR